MSIAAKWRKASALVLVICASSAHASDWQLGGYVPEGKGGAYQFFDAESIQWPSAGVARVWMKAISDKALERYSAKHQKELVEKAGAKIEDQYVPQFFMLDPIRNKYPDKKSFNEAAQLGMIDEIEANGDLQIAKRWYMELDCVQKRFRFLELTIYNDKGDITEHGSTPSSAFMFIPPDSNGDWLSMIICPQKQAK